MRAHIKIRGGEEAEGFSHTQIFDNNTNESGGVNNILSKYDGSSDCNPTTCHRCSTGSEESHFSMSVGARQSTCGTSPHAASHAEGEGVMVPSHSLWPRSIQAGAYRGHLDMCSSPFDAL